MCAGMFMGASIDISVKALADSYSTAQIVFLRSMFALPLILLICHFDSGLRSLATPRWGWQITRGLLTAGANFGFFYGIAHVPLVTAVLLAYVSPVLIVLLARPVLGERVGMHRWFGILIAFGGVLLVVRPANLDLHTAVWAIFGSAACWALLSLSNRKLAGIEPTSVLTFYTIPVSAVLGFVLSLDSWQVPQHVDWMLFAVAGFSGCMAHLLVAMAYRNGPAAAIAPFEYTTLVWTAIAGYWFWRETPDPMIWVGGAAVILGGYLSLQSPRRLLRMSSS